MAKKPPQPQPEPRKPGRPPGTKREVHAFQIRLPIALHRQLLKALAQTRRLKNAEVEIAIEKHLEGMGLWPLKEDESND